MIEKIQVTDACQVRFTRLDDEPWFILVDIATILNSRSSDLKKIINDTFIRKEKNPDTTGRNYPMLLVNPDGVRQIYQRSRSLNLSTLMNGLSHFVKEPNTIVYACKEVSWLRIVQEALSFLKSELQYTIGEYRIDLYFPDLLVAVECDENGHSDRSPSKEIERKEFIQKQLKCQFVRFNPDTPNFNIGKTISEIFTIFCTRQKISTEIINKPPIKPTKRYRENTNKSCRTCNVVKPLEEFHKAREHRDGRESVCKECRDKRQEEVAEEKRKSIPENYTEKECCACKKMVPLINFFKDKAKWDGLMPKCKDCWKKRRLTLDKTAKPIIHTEKSCSNCNVVKTISEFHKRKCSVDGHSIYCKICTCKKSKEWYDKNRDKAIEGKRTWRKEKFPTNS